MSKEYNQEFPSRRRGKESVCSPSGWKSANESKCVCALAGGAKTEAVTRGPWQKGRQKNRSGPSAGKAFVNSFNPSFA